MRYTLRRIATGEPGMPTLHHILAKLGIEKSTAHLGRKGQDTLHASQWVVDEEFMPEQGRCYELAFGRIPFAGEYRAVFKRIRIDGPGRNNWFDLDEAAALDLELRDYPIKAFRALR
jgi:hypothetical protein